MLRQVLQQASRSSAAQTLQAQLPAIGSVREMHKSFFGSKYTHMPLVRAPPTGRVSKETIARRAKRLSAGGLTSEQFRRTRQPFDFPVLTKLPVEQRKPSPAFLLQQLRGEEVKRLDALPREIVSFKVGDKIAVTKLISLSDDKLEVVKGLVIEKRREGQLESSFTIRNTSVGVAYELSLPFFSPFIRKIAMIERGEPFKRAKMTFVRDLPSKDRRNRTIV